MSDFEPFAACLRLNGVTLGQADLETALETPVHRFEPIGKTGQSYAQIDIPFERGALIRIGIRIRELGPLIQAALEGGIIGSAVLDLASDFPEGEAFVAARLPAAFAATVATFGIDLEVSVYLTEEEDD